MAIRNRYSSLDMIRISRLAKLKAENEELRKVKNDLYIHYKERKQENTQLKKKLKEVEKKYENVCTCYEADLCERCLTS